ncbi:MAG: hypothetical protein ACRDRX_22910 [Pseudonocardiaceae bacterium]
MEWTTLLGALLGAAIAMGTSLMVEMRKHRHDVAAEWRRTRRELYAAFLTSLAQARAELLDLAANTGLSEAERSQTAWRVFARCYEVRHQLELFAPPEVVDPALAYFRTVRGLRDAVRGGLRREDPEREHYTDRVKVALETTREAMRADMKPS